MIRNASNKAILAKNEKLATSIFSKAKGLMFTKKTGKALIFTFSFEQYIPLHMFFVFYPIDVLWLNKDKKVVFLKQDFKPWTMISPKKKAKYVLELKEGTIKRSNTRIGDTISFK